MSIVAAIGLLVSAIALHFLALSAGIYDTQLDAGFVWFDNVLHTMVGVAFGLIWLAGLKYFRPQSSTTFSVVSAFVFVLLMAVTWELLELAFYLIFKSQALGLKVYSPSLREAFFDSLSNMSGIVALLVVLGLLGRLTGRRE